MSVKKYWIPTRFLLTKSRSMEKMLRLGIWLLFLVIFLVHLRFIQGEEVDIMVKECVTVTTDGGYLPPYSLSFLSSTQGSVWGGGDSSCNNNAT